MRARIKWGPLVVAAALLAIAGYLGQARIVGNSTTGRPPDRRPQPPVAEPAIHLDLHRQQLANVRTAVVTRASLADSVRAVGVVGYDETRLVDVSLKVDGWIQELAVDSPGQRVRKDQPLARIYSSELYALQSEYVVVSKTRDQIVQAAPDSRQRSDDIVAAARRRLEVRDVSASDLRELDASHDARGLMHLLAPASGTVVEKQVVKGQHVAAGQTVFKIADLSVVWIEASVFEVDLPRVAVGRQAAVTLDGDTAPARAGRIASISPVVDEKMHTGRVRVVLTNPDGRLTPGRYANVELKSSVETTLTVPFDAVLDSGTRQLVFVSKGGGVFEPRPVKAGRRIGDAVQILEGVREGEHVATGATYFLDSESDLRESLRTFEPEAASSAGEASHTLDIVLQTAPDPPRTSDNRFDVSVRDEHGKPVGDADVAIAFLMPGMPSMNMPEMRSAIALSPDGAGHYRGSGPLSMAGRWDAIVTVTKRGQPTARRPFSLQVR